jgi:prefoldin subunit 5
MADLQQYQKDLDALKTTRTQVEVKLSNAVERAGVLKEELKKRGYENLDAAKADYQSRIQGVDAKHKHVLALMTQIKQVEGRVPTRDEILEGLKTTAQPADTPPEPSDPETPIDTPAAEIPPAPKSETGMSDMFSLDSSSEGSDLTIPKLNI